MKGSLLHNEGQAGDLICLLNQRVIGPSGAPDEDRPQSSRSGQSTSDGSGTRGCEGLSGART